jgi:hypothetical protein
MKPKRIIPSPEDVAAQGNVQLDFAGFLDPRDPQLPKPRGGISGNHRKCNLAEILRLQAVREAGGLVPDNGDRLVWACSACGKLHQTEGRAWRCCRAEPQLVTICAGCHEPPPRCRCAQRKH